MGNVSGTCPECGTALSQSTAPEESVLPRERTPSVACEPGRRLVLTSPEEGFACEFFILLCWRLE